MKAIIITAENKQLNPTVLKKEVGVIMQFKDIPKSFYSQNYEVGKITFAYNGLDISIHEADGFFDIVRPTYDNKTQRLGALFFDVDKFTYPIEEIPQAEIDEAVVKAAKDDFKNNLEGAFAFATTPDGTKEFAIKISNDGKISTTLIP